MAVHLLFISASSNLVQNDTNNDYDIFVSSENEASIYKLPVFNFSVEPTNYSETVYLSANGRYATFTSYEPTFTPEYSWNYRIFRKDMMTGDIILVTKNEAGEVANQEVYEHDISGDGQTITFATRASNLVSGVTNNQMDIFVKDMNTGNTKIISRNSNNDESNGYSDFPGISSNGDVVAFYSEATNLVPNDTNNRSDIFWYKISTGEIRLISKGTDGTLGNYNVGYNKPSLSSDGNLVVYTSNSSNIAPGDTNGSTDIFLYNAITDETILVSKSSLGVVGFSESNSPSINADGTKVVYQSYANNLVSDDNNGRWDTFMYDIQTGQTIRVSVNENGVEGNYGSYDGAYPTLSKDGRYVAFVSSADNFVPNDINDCYDVFVKDMLTNKIIRVSVDKDGNEADDDSYESIISQDGKYVAISSDATNLITNDKNDVQDIFLSPVVFP